eukprot:1180410-Prorocentrum_minimum.AAC.3
MERLRSAHTSGGGRASSWRVRAPATSSGSRPERCDAVEGVAASPAPARPRCRPRRQPEGRRCDD